LLISTGSGRAACKKERGEEKRKRRKGRRSVLFLLLVLRDAVDKSMGGERGKKELVLHSFVIPAYRCAIQGEKKWRGRKEKKKGSYLPLPGSPVSGAIAPIERRRKKEGKESLDRMRDAKDQHTIPIKGKGGRKKKPLSLY